jgi:GNAT superfamily N-acetyltransferase
MTNTITTRLLERSDLDSVLDLLRASLGETPLLRRTPEMFSWKHFDNPFGPSVALVAESDGRLAGLRAFMRWRLVSPDGHTIECGRAVDTATHPDFQRRGIFRRLTEEALEEARGKGIDLIFNTPNAKSGPGYLKMGWVQVGPIGAMVRPTTHFFTGRSSPEDPIDAGLLVEALGPVSALDVEERRPLGLRTPRTKAYLHWRYRSHPTARYMEARAGTSRAVVRPNVRGGRTELLVADVFGPAKTRAIRAAVRRARTAYVAAWFSKGTPERRAAIRCGLLPVPGVSPLVLMARPLRDSIPDVASLDCWDLSLGDLELL